MSLLNMEGITKVFPGVKANDNINIELKEGEILALVGENGAGKTTLMKILFGLYRPDAGSIRIKGKSTYIKNPKDAIRQGIGMVHQHFMLVPPFSVIENIVLGDETHKAGVLRFEEPMKRINRLMEENHLFLNPLDKLEDLSVGLQQRVEILKILYRGAEILVFDEPTAVLTPQEVDELFKTFRFLKKQGKGIIFISHKLDEVLDISDRLTVIRHGKIVRTLPCEEATKPLISELMVGKPVLLNVDNPAMKPGKRVLEMKNITMNRDHGSEVLTDLSFHVREGEIYGIAGVEGNGQTELVRAVAEKAPLVSGEILLNGVCIRNWNVRKRREAGISHIPEDRHKYGLLLSFSLVDNMALGRHHKPPFVTRYQVIKKKAIEEFARKSIREYDVRTPSENVPANTLSGGNQQKLIIAREMNASPVLLLSSQPTRGVDIGATEFIYKQIVKAKTEGRAVLLISADLDEIFALSDRIGVIYKGQISKEFTREEATREEVGFYMMGGDTR